MSIYKAFKNIWMIVLNILGYFGRNKQNSYAALINDLLILINDFLILKKKGIKSTSAFHSVTHITQEQNNV